MSDLRHLFNPNQAVFPIFWLPIGIPLFIATFAGLVDLTVKPPEPVELDAVRHQLIVAAVRYSNLAFISTDIWALTSLISYVFRARIEPIRFIAYFSAAIIALMFHMITFVGLAVCTARQWTLWVPSSLSLIGGAGLFRLRFSLFLHLEVPTILSLSAGDRGSPAQAPVGGAGSGRSG